MELAPSGVSLSFEVTFDRNDLHVGMSVYDDSGVSPVLVQGPSAMLNVVGNTYRGKFTALDTLSYIIFKAVYTDNTFMTLDSNYSQGSESIKAETIGGGGGGSGGGCAVIGYITNNDTVIGLVNC